jgi:hypothetical protein
VAQNRDALQHLESGVPAAVDPNDDKEMTVTVMMQD